MEVGKMSSEKNFTERLRTWAVLLVFPAVLFLFSVADMLRPAKLYSSYENRKLQQKPQLSVQAVRTGSYMKEYEDYVSDQILGRNSYIAVKSATDKALGKKEINGVYLATDGTLIEKHTEEFSAQNIEKTLEGLQKLERLLQGKSRSLQVLLAPTADNVYTAKLPAYAEVVPGCLRRKYGISGCVFPSAQPCGRIHLLWNGSPLDHTGVLLCLSDLGSRK